MMEAMYFGKKVFFGICINCDHAHHSGARCDQTFEVRTHRCSCDKWQPEDNLEFLEMKVMEKEND